MNYKLMVISTLAPLELPTFFQRYNGNITITDSTAIQYITFFRYDMQDSEWAENDSIAWLYHVQVDLWCKNMPVGDLDDQIIALMEAAGWKRENVADGIEDDPNMTHIAIRFNFLDEGDG